MCERHSEELTNPEDEVWENWQFWTIQAWYGLFDGAFDFGREIPDLSRLQNRKEETWANLAHE